MGWFNHQLGKFWNPVGIFKNARLKTWFFTMKTFEFLYEFIVSIGGLPKAFIRTELRQLLDSRRWRKLKKNQLLEPCKDMPIASMGLVYLPTFTIKYQPNVGKYTTHGWYGIGDFQTNEYFEKHHMVWGYPILGIDCAMSFLACPFIAITG